jgi:amidase
MSELIWHDATDLAAAIRCGELSCAELMNACYDQIEAHNPRLNAIVNLLPREDAIRLARTADDERSAGARLGPLHGLPMAPKDLEDAAGFPTTRGFVPFAGSIAEQDSPLVARQRAAGALFIGKTNVPEFGLGSHTFNSLFGVTRNPWDMERTAGGSSGGAAVSLASGMLPLADGSDMGGSLRNPASFCNVVGLRPSVGRVPNTDPMGWFGRLSTSGPMARSVADAALLLSVQSGPHPPDPLTLSTPGSALTGDLDRDLKGLRIAWSPDLDFLPVDPQVSTLIEQATRTFVDLGCRVERACPDLRGAMDVFQVQRAARMRITGELLDESTPGWRRHAKDATVWNIEKGLALSTAELIQSERERTRIYQRVAAFFEAFDALLLPAAQVPPFAVETEWITEINGVQMATYLDWMTICCAISVTGLPAISVPAGFTASGLPVGLQMVGRPRGDFELLQIAHGFEQATRWNEKRPALLEL